MKRRGAEMRQRVATGRAGKAAAAAAAAVAETGAQEPEAQTRIPIERLWGIAGTVARRGTLRLRVESRRKRKGLERVV